MVREMFEARESRRSVIGGALGLTGVALLRSGSGAQDASPVAGWSYTDVLGDVIELPGQPQRVAAVIQTAASLWDFGIKPATVFGWTAGTYPDGDHVAWGRIDIAGVENVATAGEDPVDPEALIAADPDLILTWIWDKENPETSMVSIPADIYDRLDQKAPIAIVNQGDSNSVELARIEELAAALGADLESPGLVEQRETLRTAEDAVRAIAEEQPQLSVLFASFNPDGFWVASPDFVGDLGYVRELGIPIANDGAPGATTYWEEISPEQALMYSADVIYVDMYGAWTTLEQLQAHSTLAAHPAIAAGQIGPWNRDLPLSYIGQTDFLNDVLAPLSTAQKVSE